MDATPANQAHTGSNSSLLTIDLGAIRHNWQLLAKKAASANTGAVVKANAYGLGIETVIPALLAAGCRHFFVAHLSEAARVRALTTEAEIFVLNGFLPGTGPAYLTHRLTPVLGSMPEIEEWRNFVASHPDAQPAALHFDTSLNRLGLAPSDGAALAEAHHQGTLGFPLRLIMSHFVEAEIEGSVTTARQCTEFRILRSLFKDIPASLCNSSGIFLRPDSLYDLLRPGYALYGGHPLWSNDANPMRAVVRLEAPIIQTRTIEAGETVGYGSFWTAKRQTRLATLSLGYADGLPRGSESTDSKAGGHVLIGGVKCAMLGRISMDLLIVDATDAPDASVQRGALATIIGDELTIDAVGDSAGTIGYDILVSLGSRFERRVIDGSDA
jgi:alanine racemase